MNTSGNSICSRCGNVLQPSVAPNQQAMAQRQPFVLKPGEVVANRYRVLDLVGRGGMGAIYRVHDNVLNEQVALKTLLPQFAQDKTVVERFYNEARIARQLSHPNIVRVHDIGIAGQVMYISMEFLQGKSLRSFLEDRNTFQPLSIRQKLLIIDQICAALEYAHRYTVHRDIKPENIMITTDGTVKLMDFGISKLVTHTRLTMTSMVMGTPQYMSPEQFRDSGNVDARADIYSLGVLLYELFTGDLPTAAAKPLSEMVQNIPSALDAVVSKCLAADPAHRYQTAHELRVEIREIIKFLEEQERQQGAEPVGIPQMEQPSRPAVWSRLLAVTLIILVSGLMVWRLVRDGGTPVSRSSNRGEELASVSSELDLVKLLELASDLGQRRAASDPTKQQIVSLGNQYIEKAKQFPENGNAWLSCLTSALQCFAGATLWQDDALVFIPPGEVSTVKGSGFIYGFFISRRPVSNAEFLEFVRTVPGGWLAPSYLASGQLDESLLGMPVVAVPYYSAQAFAAWKGGRLPSEEQCLRASTAAPFSPNDKTLPLEGLREWTRTATGGSMDSTPLQEPYFGVQLVVSPLLNPATLPARPSTSYEAAPPDVTFRYVYELPENIEQLASVFVQNARSDLRQ